MRTMIEVTAYNWVNDNNDRELPSTGLIRTMIEVTYLDLANENNVGGNCPKLDQWEQ